MVLLSSDSPGSHVTKDRNFRPISLRGAVIPGERSSPNWGPQLWTLQRPVLVLGQGYQLGFSENAICLSRPQWVGSRRLISTHRGPSWLQNCGPTSDRVVSARPWCGRVVTLSWSECEVGLFGSVNPGGGGQTLTPHYWFLILLKWALILLSGLLVLNPTKMSLDPT